MRKSALKPKRRTPEEVKQAKKDKAAKKREDRKNGKVFTKDLENKADQLAGKWCRSHGRCEAEGEHGLRCSDRLEWCHLKSRGYGYIKHDPLNFMCMCNTHHRFFGCQPDLFTDFVDRVRPGTWDRLNALLIEQKQKRLKPDYAYWIDYYKRQEAA